MQVHVHVFISGSVPYLSQCKCVVLQREVVTKLAANIAFPCSCYKENL